MPATALSTSPTQVPTSRKWLFSRWADLIFMSNVYWPLLVIPLAYVTQLLYQSGVESSVYFMLTIPHRWFTMGVIFADKNRFALQRKKLLIAGALTLLFYASLWYFFGFAVVIAVRYFWNLWHIVKQHLGLARIYTIRGEPDKTIDERLIFKGLQLFMLYAGLRLVSMGISIEDQKALQGIAWLAESQFAILDYLFMLIPVSFLIREFILFNPNRLGRTIYVTSICLHYMAMVVFVHLGYEGLAFGVAIANSIIHANEYLAISHWAFRRGASATQFQWVGAFTKHLTRNLVAVITIMAVTAFMIEAKMYGIWLILATSSSYLHYAFDGIIWKMPYIFRPSTNSQTV
jgi:hypothetical protein